MSIGIFDRCLDCENYCILGGGEPTLHPEFYQFLSMSLVRCNNVWLATNGSQTTIALFLAELNKLPSELFSCDLSQDWCHDQIDQDVVNAFSPDHIRDTSEHHIKGGRCQEDYMYDDCPCEGPQVYPNGNIALCGCDNAPIIGHICQEGPPLYMDGLSCWKQRAEYPDIVKELKAGEIFLPRRRLTQYRDVGKLGHDLYPDTLP